MTRAAAVRAGLALALAGLPLADAGDEPARTDGVWRSFAGTWSASGLRHEVPVEGGGRAVVAEVSGAVVLASGEGLSRGFLGRAIGFEDGSGRGVGRGVWTDERGDQLFSRLEGEALAAGKRFSGRFTGGTGRYAGLEGEYSFTWEYVLPGEDGRIQGRAVGLAGRVRRPEAPR